MKSFRLSQIIALPLAMLAITCLTSKARADATITWFAHAGISGDTDVINYGTEQAYYVPFSQSSTASYTVNGVTFTSGYNSTLFVGSTGFNNNTDTFDPTTPLANLPGTFGSLSANYQSILSYGAKDDTVSQDATITLSGLTSGDVYQVQLFVNNSSANVAATTSETITDSSGSSTGPVFYNTTGVAGGLGQYVTGQFVALGTSETLTFTPNVGFSPLVNAVVLSDVSAVPEPASVLMMGMGGLAGLGAFVRQRRRKARLAK